MGEEVAVRGSLAGSQGPAVAAKSRPTIEPRFGKGCLLDRGQGVRSPLPRRAPPRAVGGQQQVRGSIHYPGSEGIRVEQSLIKARNCSSNRWKPMTSRLRAGQSTPFGF